MAGSFATASSRHLVVSDPVLTGYPITMACWFSTTALGSNKCLMSINTDGSADNVLLLRTNTSDQLEAFTRTTTTDVGTTAATISSGTIHHAAAVFGSSSSRIPYLDGASGVAGTSNKTPTGMNRFGIGRYSSATTHYFDGMIAEAAIWNVALNSVELNGLADGLCPLLVRPTALVFYNPMIRTLTNDHRGGLVMTNTNSVSVTTHPRIIYPTHPFYNPLTPDLTPPDPDGADWDYTFLRPRINTRARGLLPRWPLLH